MVGLWKPRQLSQNLLKLLDESEEGKAGREFYNIKNILLKKKKQRIKGQNSILINAKIKGNIKNSIIVNSEMEKASVDKAVIINSVAEDITGKIFFFIM